MVINKTKKLLSFILSVMIMFSAILPISAVYAETGENIANLSGPTEVCRGTNVRISVLADIVKGAQGAQIDFSYSENCPKTTVTIDEEKTTVWPKGQKGANSKMILATTGMGDEDAGGKIVGYIDFKVPEDAALGTEYKISIDSFEVSGPNGVMESETESVIIIVCVVDLSSIEGIFAEDYNGTYDGKPHTAKVNVPNGASVKFGETQGNYDLDEPLSYINAGYYDIFYRVEKEGFKPYEGMAKVNIGKKALEDKMLAEISDKTYTGEKIQPEISLTDAAPCIISENDYVVEYGDNVNVKEGGTLKIKAAENGNYSGEISRSFKILPAEMEFSAKDYDGIYDGKTHGAELKITKPASAKVKFGVKDGEFNLDSMPEYKDAGEYTVFYSAEDDNYNPKKGSLKVKISPKTLDGTMIAEIPPMDFTGSALKPRITVIDQNPSIISEEDYSISYGENINVPSGTVKITGKKNYKGEAEKSFAINPVDMNVVPGDYKGTYDGAEHTGKVEVAEPSVYEIRYSTDGEDAYDTEEITATVPAAEKFSVNLTVAAGSGTVSGAGEYFKYDDAVLTASLNGNASFIGWYAGDELVSDAAVYTVKVTENINLFAKFTEETSHRGGGGRGGSSKGNTVYIKFSADGVKLDDIQVAKNTSVSSLPVPEREGYIFDGWFTDKELTKPFDENAKITAATTLYAKWSEKKAEDAEDKKDENKETGKQIILLTINSKEADVFGEKIQNDVAPVIKNGRTMLPVRFIAEALGAKVEWNGAEQKVTVKKENLEIIIFIGSDKAYVNNEENILDSAAYIENDRTMLPVRFISEKLGAKVEWNEALSQVIITKIN